MLLGLKVWQRFIRVFDSNQPVPAMLRAVAQWRVQCEASLQIDKSEEMRFIAIRNKLTKFGPGTHVAYCVKPQVAFAELGEILPPGHLELNIGDKVAVEAATINPIWYGWKLSADGNLSEKGEFPSRCVQILQAEDLKKEIGRFPAAGHVLELRAQLERNESDFILYRQKYQYVSQTQFMYKCSAIFREARRRERRVMFETVVLRWRSNRVTGMELEVLEVSLQQVIKRNAVMSGLTVLNNALSKLLHTSITRLLASWLKNSLAGLTSQKIDLCLKLKDYQMGTDLLRVSMGYITRRPLTRSLWRWRQRVDRFLLDLRHRLGMDCITEVVERNHRFVALKLLSLILYRMSQRDAMNAVHSWLCNMACSHTIQPIVVNHFRAIVRRWDKEKLRKKILKWRRNAMMAVPKREKASTSSTLSERRPSVSARRPSLSATPGESSRSSQRRARSRISPEGSPSTMRVRESADGKSTRRSSIQSTSREGRAGKEGRPREERGSSSRKGLEEEDKASSSPKSTRRSSSRVRERSRSPSSRWGVSES